MKKFLFIFLLMPGFFNTAYSTEWHTSPDKWKESRSFHTQFEEDYENHIQVTKVKINEKAVNKKFSPNKAYWFTLILPDTTKRGPWTAEIIVYNEREYYTKIKIIDYVATYSTKTEWINEKLLYVQFWFGRIMGACFIFDVEKEKILFKEMVWDGHQAFQQFEKIKGK